MQAAAGTFRAAAAVLRTRLVLGFVMTMALVVGPHARDLDAEALRSLAEQQIIVTQNLEGGYEVDYADAGAGAFELTRQQLDGLAPIVRLRIANDDALKHLYLDGPVSYTHLTLPTKA
jgi:hypothetical protein